MNQEIYNYVLTTAKKIKNPSQYEDVVQDTMLAILEKGLQDNELTPELQNYIAGIIYNTNTSIFNQEIKYTELSPSDFEIEEEEAYSEEETQSENQLRQMYGTIKQYIFQNYYSKGKNVKRWKVWYLRLKGYGYDYIFQKLGISYYTAIQYNYLCNNELKDVLPYFT
ncbi:hypothetical protein KI659_14610 [Litoribacter alkaliphilus]|uniref:Uncharacterized protein n=1 Tax=Litoribacter ruber TaxID=702568 RepID=A0AAP2G256_9BACT|nr:hypothetical protein [Litoribacter alkaliphilus]MBS9525247.1 hypothetical protein [Litoribacter alkaliphilus]